MILGSQLKNAILSGSNNISKYKKQINELNIFPVPDGDKMCIRDRLPTGEAAFRLPEPGKFT